MVSFSGFQVNVKSERLKICIFRYMYRVLGEGCGVYGTRDVLYVVQRYTLARECQTRL